ncbi:hypothetical protein IAT40_004498 [Kwoniella sp. CBS 6097]
MSQTPSQYSTAGSTSASRPGSTVATTVSSQSQQAAQGLPGAPAPGQPANMNSAFSDFGSSVGGTSHSATTAGPAGAPSTSASAGGSSRPASSVASASGGQQVQTYTPTNITTTDAERAARQTNIPGSNRNLPGTAR